MLRIFPSTTLPQLQFVANYLVGSLTIIPMFCYCRLWLLSKWPSKCECAVNLNSFWALIVLCEAFSWNKVLSYCGQICNLCGTNKCFLCIKSLVSTASWQTKLYRFAMNIIFRFGNGTSPLYICFQTMFQLTSVEQLVLQFGCAILNNDEVWVSLSLTSWSLLMWSHLWIFLLLSVC